MLERIKTESGNRWTLQEANDKQQTIGHSTSGENSPIDGAITVTNNYFPPEILDFCLMLMKKGAGV